MDLLTEEQRSRVEHVACDFLSSSEDIAKQLQDKEVKADYAFFYSYAQPKPKDGGAAWSNAQELSDVNCTWSCARTILALVDAYLQLLFYVTSWMH